MSLTGALSFVAFLGLIVIWLIPWMIFGLLIANAAKVRPSEGLVTCLLLGPVGAVILVALFVSRRGQRPFVAAGAYDMSNLDSLTSSDPFA